MRGFGKHREHRHRPPCMLTLQNSVIHHNAAAAHCAAAMPWEGQYEEIFSKDAQCETQGRGTKKRQLAGGGVSRGGGGGSSGDGTGGANVGKEDFCRVAQGPLVLEGGSQAAAAVLDNGCDLQERCDHNKDGGAGGDLLELDPGGTRDAGKCLHEAFARHHTYFLLEGVAGDHAQGCGER